MRHVVMFSGGAGSWMIDICPLPEVVASGMMRGRNARLRV